MACIPILYLRTIVGSSSSYTFEVTCYHWQRFLHKLSTKNPDILYRETRLNQIFSGTKMGDRDRSAIDPRLSLKLYLHADLSHVHWQIYLLERYIGPTIISGTDLI